MPGMKHGAFCHIEIPAASVDAAKRFYGGMFGWKFTDLPEMKYTLYNAGEGEIAGGFFNPPEGTPRMITNYITVSDLEAAAKKVPELGGRVCTERMEVPGMGWFRIVNDPEGNSVGLWQPATPKKAAAPKAKKAAKKPAKKRR
jgi:predicted enzyme related to lactoylglutathione lyase